MYCFDPRHFQKSQYAPKRWGVVRNPKVHFKSANQSGPRKCGVIRAKFLLESVIDLKQRLEAIGSDLLVFVGRPEEILPKLMMANGARTVVFTQVAFSPIRRVAAFGRASHVQTCDLLLVYNVYDRAMLIRNQS